MTLISIKKIEKQILNKAISNKAYMIYTFITIGTIFQLFKTSKYPINISANNIATILGIIILFIKIAKYSICFNIIKEKDISKIAYAIIPLEAVIALKYSVLLALPLIIININIIRHFKMDFNYWNVVNSQVITIIYLIANTFNFVTVFNRIVNVEVKKSNQEIDN